MRTCPETDKPAVIVVAGPFHETVCSQCNTEVHPTKPEEHFE